MQRLKIFRNVHPNPSFFSSNPLLNKFMIRACDRKCSSNMACTYFRVFFLAYDGRRRLIRMINMLQLVCLLGSFFLFLLNIMFFYLFTDHRDDLGVSLYPCRWRRVHALVQVLGTKVIGSILTKLHKTTF